MAQSATFRRRFAVAITWAVLLLFAAMNVRELQQNQASFASGAADFKIFYTGASIVALGQGAHLYDLRLQALVQAAAYRYTGGAPVTALPFNHPAYEAWFFVPLAFLSAVQAYYVWLGVNLLLLAAGVIILKRYASPGVPVVLILAAAAPITSALLQGQDSILLLFIYICVYALLQSDRQHLAGAMLALGLFKFHLVVPFVLLFVIGRRMWKMLAGFTVSAIAMVAASVAITGIAAARSYPAFQLQLQRDMPWMFAPPLMVNLHGLIATFLPSAAASLTLFASVILLGTFFVPIARQRDTPESLDLGFSAAILCSLLVSYHSFPHDLSLLVLPLVLLASRVTPEGKLVALLCGTVAIAPLAFLYVQPRSLLCLAMLAMAGSLFHSLREPPAIKARISC